MIISAKVEKASWLVISCGGLYLTAASSNANRIHPLIAVISAVTGFVFSALPIAGVIAQHSLKNRYAIPIREWIYSSALVGYVDPVLRQLPIIKAFNLFRRILLINVAAASLAWFELGFMMAQTLGSLFVVQRDLYPRGPSNKRPPPSPSFKATDKKALPKDPSYLSSLPRSALSSSEGSDFNEVPSSAGTAVVSLEVPSTTTLPIAKNGYSSASASLTPKLNRRDDSDILETADELYAFLKQADTPPLPNQEKG